MAGRVQVAISADGTEIVGRVRGQGPPLVLVHGGWGDGEVAYEALVPHLADRFTCYTPSTRGRGLSGDNPDHSPPRLQEDVTAFVDSIGEPVCLVGLSGSGAWVLGAAAHSDSVAAVAIYEPLVIGVGGGDDIARIGAAMQQVGAAAADGRILDSVHAFLPGSCTDNEIAALEETPFYEQWAGGIPALLRFLQQDMSYEGPRSTDPEALGQVAAPVLLLRGEQTLLGTFFADVERYVAQHVVDAHVRELPGVGHFAPLLEPEPIAKELISFFESARKVQRARVVVPPHAEAARGYSALSSPRPGDGPCWPWTPIGRTASAIESPRSCMSTQIVTMVRPSPTGSKIVRR